jgi:diacylglycerol kinase (ATP)
MIQTALNKDQLERPLFFIINPHAKSQESMKIWERVEKKLVDMQRSYQAFFTEYAGHAEELTRQILKQTKVECVICAVGGDGTLHEVVNGALHFPQAIIANIPAGSGNDYARGLQKTKSASRALETILKNEDYRMIDYGVFRKGDSQHAFINSLGIGLDAEIVKEVNESKWKSLFNSFKIGKLIYLSTFIQKILSFKPFDLSMSIDAEVHDFRQVWVMVVANQPYFGGGIKISPLSEPDDYALNILVVHDLPRIQLFLLFATVLWGGHLKLKSVKSFKARNLYFHTEQEVHIQADGEIVGKQNLHVDVSPKRIKIVSRMED